LVDDGTLAFQARAWAPRPDFLVQLAPTMPPRPAKSPLTFFLAGEQATLDFGARLAHALQPGAKLYLSGDLGAGKTTLVRGVLRALGMQGKVKSPTYALVELYKLSKLDLYHFDFYRFNDPAEWVDAGLRELFTDAAVIMVEWPERAIELLPAPDIAIAINQRDGGREVSLTAESVMGEQLVAALSSGD
jgi:tRNA threonylcarbamoyladenosine biosynthesis protein TsaE